jgi:hypothetical protein
MNYYLLAFDIVHRYRILKGLLCWENIYNDSREHVYTRFKGYIDPDGWWELCNPKLLSQQTSDYPKTLYCQTHQRSSVGRWWKRADLGLSLTEQELHSFLDKLWTGNKFELDCSTVTGTKDTLRVIHPNNFDGLANCLCETPQNTAHTGSPKLTPQCSMAWKGCQNYWVGLVENRRTW